MPIDAVELLRLGVEQGRGVDPPLLDEGVYLLDRSETLPEWRDDKDKKDDPSETGKKEAPLFYASRLHQILAVISGKTLKNMMYAMISVSIRLKDWPQT